MANIEAIDDQRRFSGYSWNGFREVGGEDTDAFGEELRVAIDMRFHAFMFLNVEPLAFHGTPIDCLELYLGIRDNWTE
jgi:hypothetical protein